MAPPELASASSTRRHISARARAGRVMSSLAKAATASSAWMRPRVSAASRAFSIAIAACWAKSPTAVSASPTPLRPCREPIAPTSRSPYHSGTSAQVSPRRPPSIDRRGGTAQARAAVRPDHRSTRLGRPPPLAARAATRPSSSKAQQTAPVASIIVLACSATLARTPSRSWPASPATIWRRRELARASSLARRRRTVRSAMASTGAALSSSWICSGVNATSSRCADTAPTTRFSLKSGTISTWAGMRGPQVGQPSPGAGQRSSAGTASAIVVRSSTRRGKYCSRSISTGSRTRTPPFSAQYPVTRLRWSR